MKRERQTTSDLCPKCGASWDCEHGARKPEKKRRPDVADEIAANIAAGAAAHPRRYLTWGEKADEVLSRIFDNGNFTPSPQEIFDAYPFGMRKYWPYKVWLGRVKWWKAGCPPAKPKPFSPAKEQGVLPWR